MAGITQATPCGLLFNELVFAPALVTSALQDILNFVLELDEGPSSHKKNKNKSAPLVCAVQGALLKTPVVKHASRRLYRTLRAAWGRRLEGKKGGGG